MSLVLPTNLGCRSAVLNRVRSPLLASALLLLVSASLEAEPHPLAVQALDRMDSIDNKGWSYTVTTRSKEGTKIERHDASKPEGGRWTLVQKEGGAPTASELRKYQKEKADQAKRRNDKPSDDDQDVDRSTIRLISEDDDSATFSFRLRSEGKLAAGFTDHISGTLVVSKAGGWPRRFDLTSAGSFRPIPGVKVDEFRVAMSFRRDPQSGDILFSTIESRVRGRAFGLKSLDDDVLVTFSDFVRP